MRHHRGGTRHRGPWRGTALVAAATICALAPATPGRAEEPYRLGAGDVIEVTVAGMPELHQRLPVQMDGSVSYATLGRLAVAGTTMAETQRAIQVALSSQVFHQRLADGRELAVTVEPRDIAAAIVDYRPIYVDGDVARPGEQPYRPSMTVRQAIAVAGGYDPLRGGGKSPAGEILDALGEREQVGVDLAKEALNVARIRRELGDQAQAGTPGDLPAQAVAGLTKSQLDLGTTNQADTDRERAFLIRGLSQLSEQVNILTRQRDDEARGLKDDTAELDNLSALLAKGAIVGQRVTDARRAVLLSSTRAMQATALLMQTIRQRDDMTRQLERLDDQRRIRLLGELSDRVARVQQDQARLRVLDRKVGRLGSRGDEVGPAEGLARIQVIRNQQAGPSLRVAVDADSALRPGDVVDVALKRSSDIAMSAPP